MKKRPAKPRKMPHPLDVKLGARIKEVRTTQLPKVSQEWLARELGCTIQQIHKYEAGQNRVTFSRLCEIAKALDMSLMKLIAPLF